MNFDESLKLRKGIVQYKLDKSKAGKSSSTAGQPRPYARKNMAIARLSAPQFVGHSFTVTPKQNFSTFRVGKYYEWKVIEPGFGECNGHEFLAADIARLFIVRKNENS